MPETVPADHRKFFVEAPYYVVLETNLFVHGGIDPSRSLASQARDDALLWDRSLFQNAYRASVLYPEAQFGTWGRIFIGHTTLTSIHRIVPTTMCNVVAMDTGGGWEGKLSILDIDTMGFWQSDTVADLYPEVRGR